MLFLLSIVISTNKTEAAVQDINEGTLNVQWEDENFGESICNALKKEEVTYADIEGITGIVYTKIRLRVQSHTYLCLKRRTIHIKIRSSGKPDSPLTSP